MWPELSVAPSEPSALAATVEAVRDDFSTAAKSILAMRVANRCSNPGCGAVTSGPGLQPGKAVNVGVAAHITAASPGGPRYDPALTPGERASVANGIWVCQTCGKLIDSDTDRYTVPVLQRWKETSEARVAAMLASGRGSPDDAVGLVIPSLSSAESLLSFANVSVAPVGRETELGELLAFLDCEAPFSWWLWTGPAGVGKSRLAVELCRAAAPAWHAGFLREVDQLYLRLLRPQHPTLIVIDYAAQRADWLSDVLLRLAQSPLSAPVRVLILERRAAGPWWDTAQRLSRFVESVEIAESAYGKPRELEGLGQDDIRVLVRAVAARLGTHLSSTDVEDIVDHANRIDAAGRPLFAQVATLDWLAGQGVSTGRDEALRRLLERMDAQAAERCVDPGLAQRVRNLRTLATARGGMTVNDYGEITSSSVPAGLLPGMFDDFRSLHLEELLDGVRPDILGELYVLDRLASGGAERAAAERLLRLAWQSSPAAYHAFVERAAGDHRDHGSIADLLDLCDWDASPEASARLAADTIPHLRHSDHPAVRWILARLESMQGAGKHAEMAEIMATARFRAANLVLGEGDMQRANRLYSELLDACIPAWHAFTGALNNRGITWLEAGRADLALADFSTVIDSTAADEGRACAFNNRADIYDQRGDTTLAIADRTAVLGLAETTYDRRYIALARRARALRSAGRHEAAMRDVEAILTTPDIAVEQKMQARMQRARWLLADGMPEDAHVDLAAVARSARNFKGTQEQALSLLAEFQSDTLLPPAMGRVAHPVIPQLSLARTPRVTHMPHQLATAATESAPHRIILPLFSSLRKRS